MVALLELIKGSNGDAVVEAAILFPIMIMIFAALVLLAVYLPTRAALQRATQFAATAMAVEKSDTWLTFDESAMSYSWEKDKSKLRNVYAALFSDGIDVDAKGRTIVTEIEKRSLSLKAGKLEVNSNVVNRVIYKEIVVTATREFTVPAGLVFIQFPETIKITVTSTAVVQNGDEFVRNMDIAADFIEYLVKKFKLTDMTDSIKTFRGKVSSFFGWK